MTHTDTPSHPERCKVVPQPSWAHLKAQPCPSPSHPQELPYQRAFPASGQESWPWSFCPPPWLPKTWRDAASDSPRNDERGDSCPVPSPRAGSVPWVQPNVLGGLSGASPALVGKALQGVQWQWGVLGWSESVEGAGSRVPRARASSQGPGAGNCRGQAAPHRTLPRAQGWGWGALGLMGCS